LYELKHTKVLNLFSEKTTVNLLKSYLCKKILTPYFNSDMNTFQRRHIGITESEKNAMLSTIGVASLDELINQTIPTHIRLKNELNIDSAMSESEYLRHIAELAAKNKRFKSFIGMGYSETVVPSVILRNVLENPGWYTAYTPYQAEISQGRLEALLNFQTMVLDLTGMEIANASLLDEGTAAGEAMAMFFGLRSRDEVKANKNVFFVSEFVYPQTRDVIVGRAAALGIDLVFGNPETDALPENGFGALIQYPDQYGRVKNIAPFIEKAHAQGMKVAVAADIMALVLLKCPGSLGADAVVGSSQRFGVPMGFGGPHAAFFATKDDYKRSIPGRIIGVSKDADDNMALRMALQTREQHIKRDKATSNICTAQALLAVMASMYAVYHGREGLTAIANEIHQNTIRIAHTLSDLGYEIKGNQYFDTLWVKMPVGKSTDALKAASEKRGINLRYLCNNDEFTLSLGEGISKADIQNLIDAAAEAINHNTIVFDDVKTVDSTIPNDCQRTFKILQNKVFNSYHSESKMMRYLKKLENKDLSLVHSMIALGSCTMKLNAASELIPITMPAFCDMHPFAPLDQSQGYQEMLMQLAKDLCEATGFAAVSLQPNSGAQGEYAGLMVIRAYHHSRGDFDRKVCLIPSSAHGTNPASAVIAGFEVVVTKCDEDGNIDVEDLREKAELHKDRLGALMVTYPSTHGVFEASICEITDIIHAHGGQVYMDGANMNAQVGLTNPGNIGADVCHLNLHKTFAIPHGGGGPGMGPIGVGAHLAPFLPGSVMVKTGGEKAIPAISSAPFGSALILLISYGYIKMLGAEGLRASTENAILNANYIKARLAGHYDVLYTGTNGTVAHEMIIDCRDFKRTADVEVADIAKRLIDYNFHAPTVSFPVAGTLMVEPTESEDKDELDRFCDAMIQIRKEIKDIELGVADKENNLLKNAPHNADCIINRQWNYPYSPKEATYPLPYLKEWKYWVPVRRVDNAYGDRNLVCSCAGIEEYMEA
jgi:glycine dehydrogenase